MKNICQKVVKSLLLSLPKVEHKKIKYFAGASLPSIKNHYSNNGNRVSNYPGTTKMPASYTSSSGLGDSLSRSPSAGISGRVDWKSKYLKWRGYRWKNYENIRIVTTVISTWNYSLSPNKKHTSDVKSVPHFQNSSQWTWRTEVPIKPVGTGEYRVP